MEFIWFGNDWFAENRTSSHHMVKRMGAMYPVLYVEVPGLKAPTANARDFRKVFEKLTAALQPPQQVGENFWRMTLPQIPFRRLAVVRGLNQVISLWLLRRAIRRLGFRDFATWFHMPHPGFLAKKLGEKLTIYYCVDEYAKNPGVDEQSVKRADNELTAAADLVFTCNQPLKDDRLRLNNNIFVSPHGVDAELFAQASAAETLEPDELRDVTRPIIGAWGLLDHRIDLEILEHVARERPQWTLLMIGRVAVDVTRLKALPNVMFAGIKKYAELPRWAKAIDVCILPYVQTTLILQSSPLKLREYLASGKPIVSVPMPETAVLGEAVETAVDGAGFVRAIEMALKENTPELVRVRQQAVAGISWDGTFAAVMERVEAELGRRG
jgi:glycosyltransferase involved in cell wall biosynthesis